MPRRPIEPLLAVCMLLGCIDLKSSLGELPGTGSETATTDDPTIADEPTTAAGDPTTIGEDPTTAASLSASISVTGEVSINDVGAPCQVSFVPESRLLDLGNADCASGVCLYGSVVHASNDQVCTHDDECSGAGEGVICNAFGLCELDPAHIAARSMCTDYCEEDADCVGVDGNLCESGFACIPVSTLGDVCCQRFCACRDDFDLEEAQELVMDCEAGSTPGCCTEDPPGAGCGG
jgi:hypothetical protein